MKSLSGIGLGLSVVFGCLLLALLCELYYLLWWKKKFLSKTTPNVNLLSISCLCKNPISCSSSSLRSRPQELCSPKPTSMAENLPHLPRFLFTIKEETTEDLESQDGIQTRNNLSDLLDTTSPPFLTPIGSPLYFTPPLTPSLNIGQQSFGLEEGRGADFNRMTCASPPPKFKFLRDAEEKMIQRSKILRQQHQSHHNLENGCFSCSSTSSTCKL